MEIASRNKSADSDIIRSYYSGEIEEASLTEHQAERLRRVRLCVSLLLDAQPHFMVVGKMMKVFSISQATAYMDMRITKSLFGKILKGDKEMWRAMAVEMALSDRQAAIKAGDLKQRNAATKNFIDASGIRNEDPELPDFSKLQPSIIVNVLPEGMENKIEVLLSGGVVDGNEMPETIDIAHEEIDASAGSGAEDEDSEA